MAKPATKANLSFSLRSILLPFSSPFNLTIGEANIGHPTRHKAIYSSSKPPLASTENARRRLEQDGLSVGWKGEPFATHDGC